MKISHKKKERPFLDALTQKNQQKTNITINS